MRTLNFFCSTSPSLCSLKITFVFHFLLPIYFEQLTHIFFSSLLWTMFFSFFRTSLCLFFHFLFPSSEWIVHRILMWIFTYLLPLIFCGHRIYENWRWYRRWVFRIKDDVNRTFALQIETTILQKKNYLANQHELERDYFNLDPNSSDLYRKCI